MIILALPYFEQKWQLFFFFFFFSILVDLCVYTHERARVYMHVHIHICPTQINIMYILFYIFLYNFPAFTSP